ncbi:hypothetical protein LTS18_009686, partial [Coniosporium uncinatum]
MSRRRRRSWTTEKDIEHLPEIPESDFESSNELLSGPSSPSLLSTEAPNWRKRSINILGFKKEFVAPNTKQFESRLLSRLLGKFPFLVEAWYWALIYWVYQLGRAFTAVTLVQGTVHVARKHALQVVRIEQALHLFYEVPIQQYFLSHPFLMMWIN